MSKSTTTKTRLFPAIPELDSYQRRLFAEKVAKGEPDACWPWTAGTGHRGYGRVKINRKAYLAHRVAYTLGHGPIKDRSLAVMHSCDNPPCCNPAHLSLGTFKANALDMVAKGRNIVRRGLENPLCILTEEIIEIVCTSPLSERAVAKQVGISKSLAHNVRADYGARFANISQNRASKLVKTGSILGADLASPVASQDAETTGETEDGARGPNRTDDTAIFSRERSVSNQAVMKI